MDLTILQLILCVFIVDSALSQQQPNTCPKVDLSVARREANHGSLKGFFAIAKGISDTIQPRISTGVIQKIKDGATGGGLTPDQLEPEIEGLIGKQVGTIIFFGFGILIAISSFFFGLSILVSRCCCPTKSRTSAEPSAMMRYTVPLVLVIAFVLLLTGVVINNQSSARLFKSAEGSRGFVKESKTNVLKLYENVMTSVKCEAKSQLDKTSENVKEIAKTVPDELLDKVKNLIGIPDLEQGTLATIKTEADSTTAVCSSIEDPVNGLLNQPSTDATCKVELQVLQEFIKELKPYLKEFNKFDEIKKEFTKEGKMYKELHKNINSYADKIKEQIGGKWDENIKNIEENTNIASAMDNAEKIILDGIEQITASKPYQKVKSEFSLLTTIPGVIAVLFILFTAALSILHLHFPQVSSKIGDGTIRRYCFDIVMIGFYIVIFFGTIVLTLSSIEYLIGASFSSGCKTFFEDDSFSAFSLLQEKVDTGMGELEINARDILTQCKDNKPLLTVIDIKSIISSDKLLDKFNLRSLKGELTEYIDEMKPEIKQHRNKIPGVKSQLESFKTYLGGSDFLRRNVDMGALCANADQEKMGKIKGEIDKIKSSAKKFRDELNGIIRKLEELHLKMDLDNKNNQLIAMADKYYDRFEQKIKSEVKSMEDEITTKLLPCGGVYTIYKNLGTYLCQDVAGPVHGIWASAGLCGLCFIFTAMIMLGVDRMASMDSTSVPQRETSTSLSSRA